MGAGRLQRAIHTGFVDLPDGNSVIYNFPLGTVDIVPTHFAEKMMQSPDALDPTIRDYAVEHGYVTASDSESQRRRYRAQVRALDSARKGRMIVSIVPTNTCNLACSYCFQSNTEMRSLPQQFMTLDLARSVVRAIDTEIGRENLSLIELFGGEPLLPSTRPVVEYLVTEFARTGLSTRVTTNGLHLHRFAHLLGSGMIQQLQISLDGSARFHDERRVPVTGAPTFARIYENVRLALDHGVHVYLRPNIDRRNLAGLPELIQQLERDGLLDQNLDFDFVNTIPDPVSPDAQGPDVFIDRKQTLAFLKAAGVDVALFSARTDLARYFLDIIEAPKIFGCGAPKENLFFEPGGMVHNCHELVGRPDKAVGELVGASLRRLPISETWANRRIDQLRNCIDCPLAFAHGGGCAARLDDESLQLWGVCGTFPEEFADQVRRLYSMSDA